MTTRRQTGSQKQEPGAAPVQVHVHTGPGGPPGPIAPPEPAQAPQAARQTPPAPPRPGSQAPAQERPPAPVPFSDNDNEASQVAEVERLLADVGPGYEVSIFRTAPLWCRGYLDRLPLDTNGLTVGDIKEAWGGKKFRLNIHAPHGRGQIRSLTLPIDDVPRRNGRQIRPEEEDSDPPRAAEGAPDSRPSPIRQVIDLLTAQVERQAALLDRALEARQVAQPAQLAPQVDPMAAITQAAQIAQTFRQVATQFGDQPPPEADPTSKMLEALAARFMVGDAGGGKTAPAAGRQAAPQQRRPPAPKVIYRQGPPPAPGGAPPVAAPRPVAPAPNPQEDVDDSENDDGDIVDDLLSLGVDQAALAVREMFDQLTPAEQQRSVDILMGRVAPEIPVDDPATVDAQSNDAPASPESAANTINDKPRAAP